MCVYEFLAMLMSQSMSLCIGSRALSFSGPLLSVDVNVCLSVCVYVRNFEVKYLENQRC